MFHKVVQRHV